MREGYSVTVYKNGEQLVTIDPSMLSGVADLSYEDARAIRDAGEHLIAFAGPAETQCFACGGVGQCNTDCPLGSINNV